MVRLLTRSVVVSIVLLLCGYYSSPTVEASDKLPIPHQRAQHEALQIIGEVYKADKERAITHQQKAALALRLLNDGAATGDDPVGRYVLLRISRDVAAGAGDINTALAAIDKLSEHYSVDATLMQAQLLSRMASSAYDTGFHYSLVPHFATVIEQATSEDRYDVLKQVSEAAVRSAKKTKSLVALRLAEIRDVYIGELAIQYAEVENARSVLAIRPTDPKANSISGEFYCFWKNDWERGLPMLALAEDEQLKSLAEQELHAQSSPVLLGDVWWDFAQLQQEPIRRAALNRAGYWYSQSVSDLAGLNKARVENRLNLLASAVASAGLPEISIKPLEPSTRPTQAADVVSEAVQKNELVEKKMNIAIAAYYDSWKQHLLSVSEYFNRRDASARQSRRDPKAAIEQVLAERRAFEANGSLPPASPVRLRRGLPDAETLLKACAAMIEEYTKAGKDAEAGVLARKVKDFKDRHPMKLLDALTGAELLHNPSCELPTVNGKIPGWTSVLGNWVPQRTGQADSRGNFCFYAGAVPLAELYQDVSLQAWQPSIERGRAWLLFSYELYCYNQNPPDRGQVVLEFRESQHGDVVSVLETEQQASAGQWKRFTIIRSVPTNAQWVRVKLLAYRYGANTRSNDAQFDDLSMRLVTDNSNE